MWRTCVILYQHEGVHCTCLSAALHCVLFAAVKVKISNLGLDSIFHGRKGCFLLFLMVRLFGEFRLG